MTMRMRWVWVVLCVAALAAAVSAAPPPPPPPPNPEIVYVESGKIIVMNSDGSNKTIVYTSPSSLSYPNLSPDAQWVTFEEYTVGVRRVERVTGVTSVLMTDAQCAAGVPRLPNDRGFCWAPRVSPTGTRVAVIDGGLSAPRVWFVPSGGGTPQVVYTGTQGNPFWNVAWSSDETRIAVVETHGGGLPDRILVVNVQTGAPRTILEGPFDRINDIDWARNGVDRFVFDISVSPDSTEHTIYTLDFTDTDVSAPVFVTSGRGASFSPDNANIVYSRTASRRRAFIARFNLGTGVSTDLAAGGMNPSWKR